MNDKQEKVQVAFQGELGAYSDLAALEFFGGDIQTAPCESFDAVFDAVENRKVKYGIVPVENSLAGSIHRNYDLMVRHNLYIIGEYPLRVSHCLMVNPGVKLENIKRVYSHPQALAQCEGSLSKLNVKSIVSADTAGSARELAERGDRDAAAIASRRAATVYGLEILQENLEDDPENYTRFLVLSRKPLRAENPDDNGFKTSIVFSLNNKPGILFKALSVFALRDIDLSKIESRPLQGKPWEYLFYIDFIGHSEAQNCRRALEHLSELAPFLRILGSYPKYNQK